MVRALRNGNAARIVAAGLLFAVVTAGTFLATYLRPAEYEGASVLLARPVTQTSPTGETFTGVVDYAMPALVEFVHGPNALENVRRQLTPSPTADDLSAAITVEPATGTALATVQVRAASREDAQRLTSALVNEIVGARLLSPVATLAPLDPQPTVTELPPPLPQTAALAIGAGLATALAALAALHLWRPAPSSALRRALHEAGVRRPVVMLDAGDRDFATRLADFARLLDRPARVVAVDSTVGAPDLAAGGLDITDRAAADTPLVLVVTSDADSGLLAGVLAALRPAERSALTAVVVQPTKDRGAV